MRAQSFLPLLAALPSTLAITLDPTSEASLKSAAATVASRMISYYSTNNGTVIISGIPGELPQAPVKYYWWETGEMFGALIDYWYYTNDTTYNQQVSDGMQFQTGPNYDYLPPNQTKDLGNDDQVFWGFAAMSAAEQKFPNPPSSQPGWLALAQAVFNTQAARWDLTSCGGGLKWQIFSFNSGYDYKNSPSNFGFFNLAARLGAYTHNSSYTEWANKTWNWAEGIGLYDQGHVWDGTDDTKNCSDFDHVEWTYSSGMALHGAAVMWSVTNDTVWKDRVNQIWNISSGVFFTSAKIMTEIACEANTPINCNTDQLSFKSTYSRFLAATTKYAPWLYDDIMTYLAASASAAAATCTGTPGGDSCSTLWYTGSWDGSAGVGQEMSALQVIQSNLIKYAAVPVTNGTGGTSQGNAAAGTGSSDTTVVLAPITTGDRAGAGILTAIIIILTLLTVFFALSNEMSSHIPFTRKG